MLRPILIALSLASLAGCATTSGNSYSYDEAGDYYSGPAGADVVIDSSNAYHGGSGFGHGYGYGWGLGSGYGGYGGYGGFYSPWGYGYPPVVWWPDTSQPDESAIRRQRVEGDRAARAALVWRPTVQAPLAPARVSRQSGLPVSEFRRPTANDGFGRSFAPRPSFAPANPPGVRGAPRSDRASTVNFAPRASAAPAPMRSVPAPAPRPSSRKQ